MAPLLPNPDRDFSAGYSKAESDLGEWMAEPPATLDDLFNDPTVCTRVGKLIGNAMRQWAKSD
jgi:hypothetical protein